MRLWSSSCSSSPEPRPNRWKSSSIVWRAQWNLLPAAKPNKRRIKVQKLYTTNRKKANILSSMKSSHGMGTTKRIVHDHQCIWDCRHLIQFRLQSISHPKGYCMAQKLHASYTNVRVFACRVYRSHGLPPNRSWLLLLLCVFVGKVSVLFFFHWIRDVPFQYSWLGSRLLCLFI